MGKTAFTGTPKILPKFITEEEVLTILSKAKKHRYRNYVLILILWRTGMRVSEALKLQKKDIAEDSIMVRQGKGKKDRMIPIQKDVSNLLGLYMDRMKPKDKLFTITTRQVRYILKKYEPDGLDVHPHTLRHSFAVHCLKNGLNLRSLQKILGHTNLNTTQIYLDVIGDDIKKDFEMVVFFP